MLRAGSTTNISRIQANLRLNSGASDSEADNSRQSQIGYVSMLKLFGSFKAAHLSSYIRLVVATVLIRAKAMASVEMYVEKSVLAE